MQMESRAIIEAILKPQKPQTVRVIYRGCNVNAYGYEWTRVVKCGILNAVWVRRSYLPSDAVEDEVYEIPASALENIYF